MSELILDNGILHAAVDIPGTRYRRMRFDWTGFIRQVTMNGHSFCVPEQLVPGIGSEGEGLCNEFGLAFAIGYDEVPVGGKFPKIGVGTQTRTDDSEYSFGKDYPNEPADFMWSQDDRGIRFHVTAPDCNGYAYQMDKQMHLSGNALIIDYTVKNVGSKPFLTQEYVHNFVAVDHKPVGNHLRLTLAADSPEDQVPEVMMKDRGTLTYKRIPDNGLYMKLTSYPNTQVRWELVDREAGVGMREMGDAPVDYFALYGTAHLISPEIFIRIDLKPDETMRYTRRYEFFAL